MPGDGFRIRYKLPGSSDKVVLEQFNISQLLVVCKMAVEIIGAEKPLWEIEPKGEDPTIF